MMEQMADDCQWHFLSHQKGIFFIALNLIDNFTFAIDFQNVFSCGVGVADVVVGAVGVGREGVVGPALGVLRGEAAVGEPRSHASSIRRGAPPPCRRTSAAARSTLRRWPAHRRGSSRRAPTHDPRCR